MSSTIYDKKPQCEYMHNWNTFQIRWAKISVSSFPWYVKKNSTDYMSISPPPPKKSSTFFFLNRYRVSYKSESNTQCTDSQWNNPFRCQLELPFQNFHVNTALWLTVLFWLRTNEDWLPAVWLELNKTAPATAYRYIILLFLILWLIGGFFIFSLSLSLYFIFDNQL